MKHIFVCFASLMLSPVAQAADQQYTREEVSKRYVDDCLSTSDDRYTLYKSCIGKLTEHCLQHYKQYADLTRQFVSGGYYACIDLEENVWNQASKGFAQQLREHPNHNEEARQALDEALAGLPESHGSCGYQIVRWGERPGGGQQLQGLYDSFICGRDREAENAITTYLWRKTADELTKSQWDNEKKFRTLLQGL